MLKRLKRNSSMLSGVLGVAVLSASQGVLVGCGDAAIGSQTPTTVQTDSPTGGTSSSTPSLVSAIFRAFSRSDTRSGTQLPDTLPPTDLSINQSDIAAGLLSFDDVFDVGDEIFGEQFTSEDGVGANLADDADVSMRFSRVPRADLPGFFNDPFRATGPNARGCASCHEAPFEDGSGGVEVNNMRDPLRLGDPARFIQRNPPHVFGLGAIQLLAEEATADLKSIRDRAISQAQASLTSVRLPLTTSNDVNYGFITAAPDGTVDTGELEGVDPDLVVKPFTWKASIASARAFVRDASNNELGMQPVEMFGADIDADHDGVSNEMTVGQITALTIYQVAQPRPVTIGELNRRDPAAFPLTRSQRDAIRAGEDLFSRVGCADCHRPVLRLKDPVFNEPSRSPDHRDAVLPSGVDPLDVGLDPQRPVSFDLTVDSPDDIPFESDGRGGALVRLYGDLKRHDMGPGLAEAIDEVGTGASVWRTRELWGVGSTGPWLHDGRANSLTEAVLFHGGEAQDSRDRFAALRKPEQAQVTKFLQSLVLFKAEEDAAAADAPQREERRRRHGS